MQRTIMPQLQDWLASTDRQPLVLRGARQVGKTWLIRHLAQTSGKFLLELNFEKDPQLVRLFESNSPQRILLNLGVMYNQSFDPVATLLFLDEIQAAPQLLSKLRWFAEEMPSLAVVAAGSLLEFTLADHTFSMPVGRIGYAHLEPFSFEEFLGALQQSSLQNFLREYHMTDGIADIIHQKLLTLFKEYLFIGGMPAALSSWIKYQDLPAVNQIHHNLLATYRDDFPKYSGKLATERLEETLLAIPRMLGEKFVYSRVNSDIQSQAIKAALKMLLKARLCHIVESCHANGVPLGAEIRTNYFKIIFLDVGLASTLLGLRLTDTLNIYDIHLINQGGICEQVVGQMLRTLFPFYMEPDLYYWTREEKGAAAEIDYIIVHNNHVIPVEVKAGSTGSLKSLHLFMQLKQQPLAVRINSDLPTLTLVQTKLYDGSFVKYQLLSIPFYIIHQLPRLLDVLLT